LQEVWKVAKTVIVDGVEYIEKTNMTGNRCVVVVDRGWIFAGDATRENGRIRLDRAILIFRWESIGFDGILANPKSNKVTLKALSQSVDIPNSAEVFSIPVGDEWGL